MRNIRNTVSVIISKDAGLVSFKDDSLKDDYINITYITW
jgi:hypothetical protein